MGCPVTQWDLTIQSVKTRLKFHSQNKSEVKRKLAAYFPPLAKERKLTVGQHFTDMVFYISKLENKSRFENRATNGLIIQPGMIQNLKLSQIVSG